MKVALYARVSTTNHHQDPELQLRDLRHWAEANGHQIAQEYVDHGVSGAKASRPALEEMMKHAEHGRFDAVVVWKLDRFGRSLQHLVNAVAQLTEWHVAFVAYKDNIDLSTPAGRLLFGVMASMAEFERSLIQERVKAGLRNARAKGKKLGRPESKNPDRTTLWRRRKRQAETQ